MSERVDPERALALARGLGDIPDATTRVDQIERIVALAGLPLRGPGASLHDIAPPFSISQRDVLRAIAKHHGSLGTVRAVRRD